MCIFNYSHSNDKDCFFLLQLPKATSCRWKLRNLAPQLADEYRDSDQANPNFRLSKPVEGLEDDEPTLCVVDNFDNRQQYEDKDQTVLSDESVRSRTSSESSFQSSNSDFSRASSYGSEQESCFGHQSNDCNSDFSSDSTHSESSDDECFDVYKGSEFSVDEAILDLLTDHIENFETKASLKDHLKTFLKYLPKKNNMPKTLTQIFTYIEQLVPSYREIPFQYCGHCCLLIDFDGPCKVCDNVERNVFYLFSLEEQIRFYFEERNLAQLLDNNRCNSSRDGLIRDCVDGTEYLKVNANDEYSLTLIMNTDGVSISKSSKKKLWPVMFVICELPPHLRKRFMILGGVWCDNKDAPMNVFMKPVVDGLLKIHDQEGVVWTHPRTEVQHRSKVCVPAVCADAPARAKIQNIKSHTGIQGCNTCEQSMVRIALTAQERRAKAAGQKNIRQKRGYVFQEDRAPLRTDEGMRRQAREAINSNTPVNGVKGPSILACIPNLNIARCVYSEYMHGTCLGCVKHFVTIMLSVPGPWSISQFKFDIDDFMKSVAPSSDIFRLPRPLTDFKHWKASEFRAWLLYYSVVCLKGKLPNEYFKHWCLLVNAIFLLLKEEISEEDLNNAEAMLVQFVKDVGRLYRLRDYTYNVHQLLHLTKYVKWWGPLWSTSAFQFENYNGTLAKLIHGSKNPGKELMKNVRLALGVEILRNKVLDRKIPETESTKDVALLNQSEVSIISEVDLEAIRTFCGHVSVSELYLRVRRGKITFTSKLYTRQKKRSNYTVQFKSRVCHGYGDIKYFIVSNNNVLAVLGKLRINHAAVSYDQLGFEVKHIVPTEDAYSCTVVVKLNDIVMKKLRVGNAVCHLPNSIEKNL